MQRQLTVTVSLCMVALSLSIGALSSPAMGATAGELLRADSPPHFAPKHSLPPLTRWGWMMSFEVNVELAERWGYAIEFGTATDKRVASLDDPQSEAARLVALAAKNPQRYPLSVLVNRPCLSKSFRDSLPPETWTRDKDGKLLGKKPVWSPVAPDSVFQRAAEQAAAPLRRIRARAPIAVLLNGGEYGLNVYGWAGKQWKQDPRVMAAKGDKPWFDFISERKGHQEGIITEAIRRAVPDRRLYIFYFNVCAHRNRYGGWWTWAFDFPPMKNVSDLPSSSVYFKHFNSGWTGAQDMLTMALNCVTQSIAQGMPLSYNWLCGGWPRGQNKTGPMSDPEHYMGYLKCYYTAGMVGGVAGYFSYPRPNGFKGDVGDEAPPWLWQMTVLSRAHALFSHLEDFLRQGDLLPGPNKHRWSKDLPAYEFPTGVEGTRVLVRRHRQRPEWLVTAWANGSQDADVTVAIPQLGKVGVRARTCGSVYRVRRTNGQTETTLIDENGMAPTASLR